ncbi:MAG: hypothetical protein ACLR8Y_00180 [Alistipes indistinctus]
MAVTYYMPWVEEWVPGFWGEYPLDHDDDPGDGAAAVGTGTETFEPQSCSRRCGKIRVSTTACSSG